jgi:hypothetical protein
MRIDAIGPSSRSVAITLSRSNLLALLAKLDGHPAGSEKSISRIQHGGPFTDVRVPGYLTVTAEEDDVHYVDRERGIMHPDTEKQMSVHGAPYG